MKMFEDVFHRVEAELGPLNSHWFEELTAKASKDGYGPVQDTQSNKEGDVFKAPAETSNLDTQLSSTPRIFRHRGSRSPFPILGDCSAPGMHSPLQVLWTDSSPWQFGSAKEGQQTEKYCGSQKTDDCFGLLDTPKSCLVQDSDAKRISESLGAQLNPDLSWSSSFNTPSLTPTVILSKKEVQSSPVSFFKDKEVIIVRNLFPSLSKGTESTSERGTTVQHNDMREQADSQAPNTSFDDMDGIWRQTVPDAIKDDSVRDVVEHVLDGAEDVLSIFFSNSSSALRKVRTKERIKKRVNDVSKHIKTATLTTENSAHLDSTSNADSGLNSADTYTAAEIESPPKTKDFTQWTPLSLSDVPDSMAKPIINNELANKHSSLLTLNSDFVQTLRGSDAQVVQYSRAVEKRRCCPDSYPERSQARSSFLEPSPVLTHSRKPRKFVYRVQSPRSSSEVRKRDAAPACSLRTVTDSLTENHIVETSLFDESKHGEDFARTADTGDHLSQPGETTAKQITLATLSIDHGLNMTQLCKAFTEDFTQEVNMDKSPNKSTQRNDCLVMSSCMTQSVNISEVQLKALPEDQPEDDVDYKYSDANRKETNATEFESMACRNPDYNSDHPAMLSDCRRVAVSCSDSENDLHSVFKAANEIILVHPEAVMKANATLDEVGQCRLLTDEVSSGIPKPTKPPQKQDSVSPGVAELPPERYSHQLKYGETSNFESRGSSECGFKTASNKCISVSSDNLEKAKEIFKELDENADKLHIRNVKPDKYPVLDFKSSQKVQDFNRSAGENSFLTASQKADVTELCSILEEACSQHEFTQVRHAKLGVKPVETAHSEKHWDSDILADIDFDDSFNCYIEKRVSQKHQAKTDLPNVQVPVPNSIRSMDVFIQNTSISQACHNPQEIPNMEVLRSTEMAKTLKGECKISEENKSFCFGFKTASGNILSISDKCLSKARSLFADLEDVGLKYDSRPTTNGQKLNQSPDYNRPENSPDDGNGGSYCHKQFDKLHLTSEENLCNENPDSAMKETQIHRRIYGMENLEAEQGAVDHEPNLLQTNAVNFGIGTAGGKDVKVSEKAKHSNEVENFEARNTCEAIVSLKDSRKTKAVSRSLTPVHNQSDMLGDALYNSNMWVESLTKAGEETCHNDTGKKVEMFSSQTSRSIQTDWFKLASGKAVLISASAIQKSKAIFKDIENSVNCSNGIKLEDGNSKLDSEANRTQNKSIKGCRMASSEGVSISEKAFMEAKAFFKDSDLDSSDISQGKGDKSNVMDDCGFKAVVGSTVHLPEIDSLNKEALSLKQQSPALNKYVRKEFGPKTSAQTLQSTSGYGFSTASGKMVSVSAEALQRAKAVLGDSTDDSPCEKRMEISEEKNVPETHPTVPGRGWSFSTASGKKVAVSDKALQKAKSLFSGCEVEGLQHDGGLLNVAKTSVTDPEHFSAASCKDVTVSEKALLEVKAVFTSCSDLSIDAHEQKCSHSTTSSDAGRPERKVEIIQGRDSRADTLKSGNAGFSTASGKSVSVSKSALRAALQMFRDCDAGPVSGVSSQSTSKCQSPGVNEKCLPVSDETGQNKSTIPSQPGQDGSLLTCGSFSVNGSNVTQKYVEQEAMACTKALLEDDLNEHSLLESAGFRENPLQHKSSCEAHVARKRMSGGGDLTGQPPLKRRLVSEFNQISDGSRVCAPVTGSPNGILSDRAFVRYSLHLKPNITHPPRDVTDRDAANPDLHVAFPRSTDQKRRVTNLKTSVFVPPFQKKIMPEAPKPCISRDIAKVPSVFVPPLKKQNSLAGTDLLKRPSQNSSISNSPSTLSSGLENKMSSEYVKPHMAGKQVDWKKETESHRDMTLDGHATLTCEEKVSEGWQQSLELARDMQDMRLRKKKRQTVRPLPGSLYLAKTSGVTRIPLREAVGYKYPVQYAQEELYRRGVHCRVSQISSETAESFRFNCAEFFPRETLAETGGVLLADGGWLIPDSTASAGKEEFYRALCDTPGVDPKLISEAWVYNHYRWIVWKRASMERAFPEVWGGLCLTPEQVLLQLKLRYDTEVDHSQRSALKKIMERDDTPAKTLVLCVCSVVPSVHVREGTEKDAAPADPRPEALGVVVMLTDGWYFIKALLDLPLSSMLQKGRLRVGGKIMIHGAELIGSQDACSPLEAPDSLMLKISANSTRPARWDAKLGFHKDPRPFQLPLSSLFSTGGVVGCVDIIVLRSYPVQWMEKKSCGAYVFRNERAEDREARHYSSAQQQNLELLFSNIQAQFEKEEEEKIKTRSRRTFNRHEIENLQDGEMLCEAMESDPGYVEARLSARQVDAVTSYRRGVAEQRQAELQERVRRAVQEAEGARPKREVTPVWKLAIADYSDQRSNRVYTMNIWRPSAELSSLLREGGRYKAHHLAASEAKKRSASTHVQFTATKKTQFQDLQVCPEWLSKHFPARRVASFRDLQNPRFSSPCAEVDVVGYVISILDRQGSSPLLYLADDEFDFVYVRISSSLDQLAVEDLVKPRALLAVSNLQLQRVSSPAPSLYAGDQVLFSIHPKEPHLQEAMGRLKTFVQGYESFFSVAEQKLSDLIPASCSNSFQSPRAPGFLPKHSVRTVTPQPAGRVFSPFTPVLKRSPVSTSHSELKDTRSVKRKRGMDYLSRMSSPPPISPLAVAASPGVSRTFNPPRRSETPRPSRPAPGPIRGSAPLPVEEQWVNDEELAMINTQALLDGPGHPCAQDVPR